MNILCQNLSDYNPKNVEYVDLIIGQADNQSAPHQNFRIGAKNKGLIFTITFSDRFTLLFIMAVS